MSLLLQVFSILIRMIILCKIFVPFGSGLATGGHRGEPPTTMIFSCDTLYRHKWGKLTQAINLMPFFWPNPKALLMVFQTPRIKSNLLSKPYNKKLVINRVFFYLYWLLKWSLNNEFSLFSLTSTQEVTLLILQEKTPWDNSIHSLPPLWIYEKYAHKTIPFVEMSYHCLFIRKGLEHAYLLHNTLVKNHNFKLLPSKLCL